MLEKSKANCRKKARYPTEHRARIIGQVSSMRRGVTLWPYRCPHCEQWHLTRRWLPVPSITAEKSGIFA